MYAQDYQQQLINQDQLPLTHQDQIYEEEPSREYEQKTQSKKLQG